MGREKRMAVAGGVPPPTSLAALRPTLTKSKSSTIHPFSLYPVVTAREAGCRAGAGRQSWNHQLSPSSPLLSCSYQVPPSLSLIPMWGRTEEYVLGLLTAPSHLRRISGGYPAIIGRHSHRRTVPLRSPIVCLSPLRERAKRSSSGDVSHEFAGK